MIRYYPNPEGYKDPAGAPYPDMPAGFIRAELDHFLQTLQAKCEEKEFKLELTSLNHGAHVGNSMHYRGLAMDFNIKAKLNYLDFKAQAELAAEAAEKLEYDAWIWVEDPSVDGGPPTHTHISIHPKAATPYDTLSRSA